MNDIEKLIAGLNAPSVDERLSSLRELVKTEKYPKGEDVNNHIHTIYSFSPYSPTKAVWMAYKAGLATAGIMDHDSVSGLCEFRQAGEIAGLLTTGGLELRVSFADTPLCGRRINNPDQKTVAYSALHGIPLSSIPMIDEYLRPIRAARGRRNLKMVDSINDIFRREGITINYEADVLPRSMASEGGGVTERHVLYALTLKLLQKYGATPELIAFLRRMDIAVSASNEKRILEKTLADYDLLGVLKSSLVSKIYVDADEECPPVRDFIAFASQTGGIAAYPYLGDVGESVTGDKKAQSFEDSYLGELFDTLKEVGYKAVTYMPSRNTDSQLQNIRSKCVEYGFMQISGEDINTPRQSFICLAARRPDFANLKDAAYELIAHERRAEKK